MFTWNNTQANTRNVYTDRCIWVKSDKTQLKRNSGNENVGSAEKNQIFGRPFELELELELISSHDIIRLFINNTIAYSLYIYIHIERYAYVKEYFDDPHGVIFLS